MRTIAVDCRFAGTGTGLARYTRELVEALVKRAPADFRYILIVRHPGDMGSVPLPNRVVTADIPHYSRAEQTALPSLLRSLKADLTFFPHFNAPFLAPQPMVVTVHDLILHRHPGTASLLKQAAYRVLVHRALRRAARIIAVSHWTKHDVRSTYGTAIDAKTTVIGEGVSDLYQPSTLPRIEETRRRYGLHRPFFLYVGNAKPHKNLPLLLRAFAAARPDAELVLVSSGPEARSLSLPAGVRLLEDVEDQDLPQLYGAARCFVTASLDEGYCLPIAEALACGCPVMATNRTAIPEIVSVHGRLLAPTVEAFADAFLDPPTLAAAVRVGTWEDAAAATEALLCSVLPPR